jgi:glucose/arabinose dehydrogenase
MTLERCSAKPPPIAAGATPEYRGHRSRFVGYRLNARGFDQEAKLKCRVMVTAGAVVAGAFLGPSPVLGQTVLMGSAAYGDWRSDAPGVTRRIAPADIPAPSESRSVSNAPDIVDRPSTSSLRVPAGFAVTQVAAGLTNPRIVRVAPNGDIFVAESIANRIRVMRAADGATQPQRMEVFARGLDRPFGMGFYPPGPNPQWLYVADTNSVVRFPYRNGDLAAMGQPQIVVAQISQTSAHHWTRDLAFSRDGKLMYVSVGSGSNDAEDMGPLGSAAIAANESRYGVGASWGNEAQRADVLAFDPRGGNRHVFATGLRNCAGLAVNPRTCDVWCSTNERDGLGNNVPPDYVTRVREGGFYGWPWFYIGDHQDSRHAGERPDLAGRVDVPDVLIQTHSAPLGMAFYQGVGVAAFPSEYTGDAFVALHGSWTRAGRTGYKVIRIPLHDGIPEGVYQDFLTGFVASDSGVWGRPVGIAVAHDGALLITDDGGGVIWRVAYGARRSTK